jgi:hypothetical protein
MKNPENAEKFLVQGTADITTQKDGFLPEGD